MNKLYKNNHISLTCASVNGTSLNRYTFFLLLLLSSSIIPRAESQTPSPPEGMYNPKFSPSMAIIIVILIAALFFMGFFSVYIRHCSNNSGSNTVRNVLSMRRRAAAARGLDAAILETFPTFSYAEVKDHKIGKGALECAVCLNEFEDDETLRLLPKCDHVFHPECIDAWLESHTTCPVCRANLVPDPDDQQVRAVGDAELTRSDIGSVRLSEEQQRQNGDVVIDVDTREQNQAEEDASVRPEAVTRPPRSFSIKRPRAFGFGKFRSHSTGHSVVVPGENLDRFTLRLPQDVRKEVINRAYLNRTGSVVLPRVGSSKRGYRTAAEEGSSRGARFNRRIEAPDRTARSDRWVAFFSRGLSMRSPRVVAEEGSTSKSPRPAMKLPSFKCLEPKGDEAGLIGADSAKSPV